MVNIQKLADKEICLLVHDQETSTELETELMTRLLERASGSEDPNAEIEIEVTLDDDKKMIRVDNAMMVCAAFMLIQGMFILYVVCPSAQ